MIDPRETREDYQRALAWIGEQITEAERQGLTLDYLGGWHRYTPNPTMLERAWRVLYGIPDAMTDLFTSPETQWAMVILRWERHRHEQAARDEQGTFDRLVNCATLQVKAVLDDIY